MEHIVRWRVNGALKLWKRDPARFRLPIKYGLRSCWYIDEFNADLYHWAEDCPLDQKAIGIDAPPQYRRAVDTEASK